MCVPVILRRPARSAEPRRISACARPNEVPRGTSFGRAQALILRGSALRAGRLRMTGTHMIEVRRTGDGDPLGFEVLVREGKGETRHQVTMSRKACERLTGGKHAPERLIEAAFFFLLDREPKESILGRFDVTLIARYFPEFERELPKYLSPS